MRYDPLAWNSKRTEVKDRHSKTSSLMTTMEREEHCSSHWNPWRWSVSFTRTWTYKDEETYGMNIGAPAGVAQ